ncbi:sensor histidine kinase [Actomonas aquatica]|uniref:histidine kinase n=1 Tax=Actomonas aquatica TaxID=2866162 RepID=A0ABZ1C5U8_9BACT|nr:HAMP domain-containing sensor histidine kinase [Opitutus sp. WL0086]WRQ86974.1 HAMP domain-containing sensor histidine kinase [Opitutus sp. WL0086]
MITSPASASETSPWRRRAKWRLQFAEASVEKRFRHEWLHDSVIRSRVMIVVAIFATLGMGLVDARVNVGVQPEFVWMSLWQRVLVVAPAWLVMWILPSWHRFERTAWWIYPLGTAWVIFSLGLIPWEFQRLNPGMNMVPQVMINSLGVATVSVFTLPLSFRAALLMQVLGFGGIVFLLARTLWGDRLGDLITLSGGLGGFLLVLSAFAWTRESRLRREYAQREELALLNRELARLNAEKNEFMAAAAHDLRAPLASVRGLASQMRLGRMEDPDRRGRALSAIDDLSGRMLEVVNNYLGEHALESGTLPVRLEMIDLRKVINEAAGRHGPAAAAKEQQVLAPAGEAVWARADASLLGQVLDNFLSNALKFSPRGATVRLALGLATATERVRIEVIDTGPGVNEADRGKLFRKYSGSGARPTGGESSHGIGLAVTKRVAEAMGGEVGCDSAPGAGATFWISLPVR